jgi:DNA-binding NarL/FixJ family response regulator
MGAISIALVDDHPMLLAGVAALFEASADFDVVATGATADSATEIVARYAPNILVLDLSMPGNAFGVIAAIAAQANGTKVVVFTALTSTEIAVRALEAGASAYILKGGSAEELLHGVRAAHGGTTYISPEFAGKVILAMREAAQRKSAAQQHQLSVREEQIVGHLMHGRTNKEIAARLGIGEKTVKHYMTILMHKMRARNRLEVVIAAQKLQTEGDLDKVH